MQDWQPSQEFFQWYSEALDAKVREMVPAGDLNDIFAPRVSDDVARSFFPGFAVTRFPDARAHIYTRFGAMPKEWQQAWHARLWLNTLSAIAEYDSQLRELLTTEGPASDSEKAIAIIGPALAKNWMFGLWGFAVSEAIPNKTYMRVEITVLECCFVIESVESRVDGKPGGWRLVEEVLHILDSQGTSMGIPWIHVLATNPDAVALFRKHGFTEQKSEAALHSERATFMRRAVKSPDRPFGSPPPDLKHLFPDY